MVLGTAQRRHYILPILDPYRLKSVSFGQLYIIGSGYGHRFDVIVEEHLLPLADHAKVTVVENRYLERQVFLSYRCQLLQSHLKPAIAGDGPDRRAGLGGLHSHGGG